jgi:hypothetical protein
LHLEREFNPQRPHPQALHQGSLIDAVRLLGTHSVNVWTVFDPHPHPTPPPLRCRSNAKALWVDAQPMDAEELLMEQAKVTRAVRPDAKIYVYRNSIKALNWFTSVR